MISVEQAFQLLMKDVKPLGTVTVPTDQAMSMVLAKPVVAQRFQPPLPLSAMDGIAVKSADLNGSESSFDLIGQSFAGIPFSGKIKNGQSIKITTGAVVPADVDQVIPIENVVFSENKAIVRVGPVSGAHIRPKGLDFEKGQIVLNNSAQLTARALGLVAASGHKDVIVFRKPKVAILATGDELVKAGMSFSDHQQIDSVTPMLKTFLKEAGADITACHLVVDDPDILEETITQTMDADIVVTIGGVSVGEKDFLKQVCKKIGAEPVFHKIAMRPGKPLMIAKKNQKIIVGLPGNAVSAFICAVIFVRPLMNALLGRPALFPESVRLPLSHNIDANGARCHFMRARLIGGAEKKQVEVAENQDSSLVSVLAWADGVVMRQPYDKAHKVGHMVPFIPF